MGGAISDAIYGALRKQIITGELAPGEKLRQDHIAKSFETSHVPVREAFLRLEAHGLAVSEPRRGTRVAALNPSETSEVIEMRIALETLALRHAVQKCTLADAQKADVARRLCDESADMPEWETRNRAFHRMILAPCVMPRLLGTIEDLQAASARYLFAHWQSKWTPREDPDHAAIVVAMKRRDAETAVEVLRRHIRRVL